MNYRRKFAVEPGSKVRLADIDPSYTAKHATEAAAQSAIAKDIERLRKLQYRLYAEHERSLLIVLQAPDAGGKDGTIRHVFGALNPQGASVHAFKVPTPEEAAHDFLWRAHKAGPPRGQVAIFNRSHYEDVLVARVRDLVPKRVWSKRYDRINEFEKTLAQAGTHILKFYLHISKDEQLRPLRQAAGRARSPLEDQRPQTTPSGSLLGRLPGGFRGCLERCSTRSAPWYVIPANHKWFRNLAIARIVADALDDLDLQLPKPSVDPRGNPADVPRRGSGGGAR